MNNDFLIVLNVCVYNFFQNSSLLETITEIVDCFLIKVDAIPLFKKTREYCKIVVKLVIEQT